MIKYLIWWRASSKISIIILLKYFLSGLISLPKSSLTAVVDQIWKIQAFIIVNAMPLRSMIIYCPRSSLTCFTRFQSSRKWGKSSLLSEAETAEWMTKSRRNEFKKSSMFTFWKCTEKLPNVVKKIYEKVWMETGKTRTMCGRVSEKSIGWEAPEGKSYRAGREKCQSMVHGQRSEDLILYPEVTSIWLCGCNINLKEKLECSNGIHDGKNWHQIRISRSGERQKICRIVAMKIRGISKIQLVVYYQCCVLIGWATTRLYVIAP